MKGTKPVILAVITALIIKLFVFDFIIADGHSMEPAIEDRTVLIISRLAYKFRQPQIGEIVVFYTPDGELAVKRCVMVEGDSFYAEGDNSLASYDSRAYGPVPLSNIIGKVLGY
ncbi:MAG: signal peptidase I [Treponema sp.]|nr:signal peptidase I [Treponema sp.]